MIWIELGQFGRKWTEVCRSERYGAKVSKGEPKWTKRDQSEPNCTKVDEWPLPNVLSLQMQSETRMRDGLYTRRWRRWVVCFLSYSFKHLSIMAVKYSLAKMNTKLNGKAYEKVYAHAQVNRADGCSRQRLQRPFHWHLLWGRTQRERLHRRYSHSWAEAGDEGVDTSSSPGVPKHQEDRGTSRLAGCAEELSLLQCLPLAGTAGERVTWGMKLARLYIARKSRIKEKVRPWVALFLYLCIK